MKTIFTAIILVFSISIFAQREEPKTAAQSKSSSTTGSNYFNDDPFFKINFIKTPSKEANDIETAVGMIKMVSYMVEEPTVAYMVAYSTYPSSSVNASSAQVMLDNAIGGFIGNLGMTIISQKEISLQGHKGIFFKASSDIYYATVADYLVQNTLFQIGICEAIGFLRKVKLTNLYTVFS